MLLMHAPLKAILACVTWRCNAVLFEDVSPLHTQWGGAWLSGRDFPGGHGSDWAKPLVSICSSPHSSYANGEGWQTCWKWGILPCFWFFCLFVLEWVWLFWAITKIDGAAIFSAITFNSFFTLVGGWCFIVCKDILWFLKLYGCQYSKLKHLNCPV